MIERAQALRALATAQLSARGYSPQEHCTPIKPEEILELIAASEKLEAIQTEARSLADGLNGDSERYVDTDMMITFIENTADA